MSLQIVIIALYYILYAYRFIMWIGILMTWIPNASSSRFGRFVFRIVDLYLWPFHGWIVIGNLDFTTIIGLGIYEAILSLLRLMI